MENNQGLVTNAPSNLVAWSDINNIRFKPGCVYKSPGKELLATTPGSRAVRDMFSFVDNSNLVRTIVCCDDKIYSYQNDFTEYLDITPTVANDSDSSSIWQFALIKGCPFLTNGVDAIWYWPSFGSVMIKATNIPLPKYMTTAYHRLLLGNVLESGYEYQARIRWSDIKNPLNFVVDKTVKAGHGDIVNMGDGMDTSERIKGLRSVGEITYIFADRTIWYLTLHSKPYTYKLNLLYGAKGLLASRAQVVVDGIVYMIGMDDFYTLTTQGQKSIGAQIRNSVFPNINAAASHLSFAYYQPSTREIFFCLPMLNSQSSSNPVNTAYIYNLELNNWSKADVDYLCHSYSWNTDQRLWDAALGDWDSNTDKWDTITNNGIMPYSVVGNDNGQILKLDSTYNNNGSAIYSYLESGDMELGDAEFDKLTDSLYLSMKPQDTDTPLIVQIGSRESLSHPIVWSKPTAFTIGISRKVDIRSNGKYHRIRLYTNQVDDKWTLESYRLEYTLRGRKR